MDRVTGPSAGKARSILLRGLARRGARTAPDGAWPAVTGQAATGQAATGPAVTGPAATGPAATGPAATGPAATGSAATRQAATGQVTTGSATTGQAANGPAPIGPAATGQAATGQAATGQAPTGPAAAPPAASTRAGSAAARAAAAPTVTAPIWQQHLTASSAASLTGPAVAADPAPAAGPVAGHPPGAQATPGSPPVQDGSPPAIVGILGQDRTRRDGPVRTVLAGLTADPRLDWWVRRTALAAAAAAVVTALSDWRLGVTAAALTAIADTIYRARTSEVIPATARLTSAQRRTRRRLARLGPAGYLSLHSRVVPGAAPVIHHLVVGPAGVYAVHSQRWDRRLPVRATQGGRLFHGPFEQADRLAEVRWQAAQSARLISTALGRPVTVSPAMVVYGPIVPWIVARIGGVDVFKGRRLRRYLRREAAARREHRLGPAEVELIHATAARLLPPAP